MEETGGQGNEEARRKKVKNGQIEPLGKDMKKNKKII
jgi:hypothetical protein